MHSAILTCLGETMLGGCRSGGGRGSMRSALFGLLLAGCWGCQRGGGKVWDRGGGGRRIDGGCSSRIRSTFGS